VLEVDLGVFHLVPGLPGDLEEDQRDHESDDRVGDLRPKCDRERAEEDAERNEAVGAGVPAVGKPGAVPLSAAPKP